MNPPTAVKPKSVFHECDFCRLQGVLDQNIFNKAGWYFCKPCLLEVEAELEKRKQMDLLPTTFSLQAPSAPQSHS